MKHATPHRSLTLYALLASLAALPGSAILPAQEPDDVPVRDVRPGQPTGETVTIHREALRLIDPGPYNQPLHLAPGRELALSAVRFGTVRAIRTDVGERMAEQQIAVELDPTELDLQLSRAEAELKIAELEKKQARTANKPDEVELAEARVAAAQAGRELAQHYREQTLIRAPFSATVFEVHVAVGQVVRPGDPLVTIGDTSRLQVEIPVSRTETGPGKTIELQIEQQTVTAKIERLRPLHPRFAELRNLLPTAVSAVIVLDNADGRFERGQNVFAPTVPRQPITEVANSTLSAGESGVRKVQVVRDGVIRDIPVMVLTSIGPERSFVAGAFRDGDELVLSLSMPLADGTRIRPAAELAKADPAGGPARPAANSTAARVNAALRGMPIDE